MTLTAATRAQAKRFCERWPSRAPFLYQTIMEQLGEADTEKTSRKRKMRSNEGKNAV